MIRTLAALSFLLFSTSALAQTVAPKAVPAESKPAAAAPAPAADMDFAYAPKDTDIAFGKADAPVTVVEYASLSCPHCAAFYRDVFPQIEKTYVDTGKARFVYRDYPLNQPALEAAQMLQCADKDAKPTYLKVLFGTQEKWALDANYREALAGIAVLGGMDRKKFDDCMNNKQIQSAILLNYQEAREKFRVASTPTLYVNDEQLKGNHNFTSLSKAIESAAVAKAKK